MLGLVLDQMNPNGVLSQRKCEKKTTRGFSQETQEPHGRPLVPLQEPGLCPPVFSLLGVRTGYCSIFVVAVHMCVSSLFDK